MQNVTTNGKTVHNGWIGGGESGVNCGSAKRSGSAKTGNLGYTQFVATKDPVNCKKCLKGNRPKRIFIGTVTAPASQKFNLTYSGGRKATVYATDEAAAIDAKFPGARLRQVRTGTWRVNGMLVTVR